MEYVSAFIVGGLICVVAQVLMDTTKLTPARILVIFVTLGAILGGFGIYDKLVQIGGAGATIPLPSFGNGLAKAAIKVVKENGLIGAFIGGIEGAAGGIYVPWASYDRRSFRSRFSGMLWSSSS